MTSLETTQQGLYRNLQEKRWFVWDIPTSVLTFKINSFGSRGQKSYSYCGQAGKCKPFHCMFYLGSFITRSQGAWIKNELTAHTSKLKSSRCQNPKNPDIFYSKDQNSNFNLSVTSPFGSVFPNQLKTQHNHYQIVNDVEISFWAGI